MYIYKTENIKLRWKWFSDKPDEKDIANLDRLINERAAEGWELVTYNTLLTSIQWATAFLVTFRKPHTPGEEK